jgi:hypothetical protein
MFVMGKYRQRCLACSASKQFILFFCSIDDGIELEDRTHFVCLKCGDQKLPGDSSTVIGTPSHNNPTGKSFEEPSDGSQIFCVEEDNEEIVLG